jgi:hypothetical protein
MPNKRLPVYRLVIDENTEGMDFMGLVDYPAHGKNWMTFAQLPVKVEQKYAFNEEKQIVTGVAIATNLQIYRRDPNGFEYNVIFTKDDALKIMKMFAKKGYHNNVNLMHDQSRKVSDAYLIESYFIKDDKSNIPAEFAGQNIQPGSLIFSYWIEGKETWKFVKENAQGFSIEGWFKEIELKFINQKKMKKSLLERLGFSKAQPEKKVFDKENKSKYATAKTADGMEVYWEGDLVEGASLFIVPAEGGDPVLASAGEYAIEVDGAMWVVTVDEAGLVTSVAEAEDMADDENAEVEEAMKAMNAKFEKQLADQKKEFDSVLNSKLSEIAKDVDAMREAIEKLAEGKPAGQTFQAKNSPSWRKKK